MKCFTPNFYSKKVTPHSEINTRKTKNFTPTNKTFTQNPIFFNQIRKFLQETLKCLQQI